ncbi:MAG TPA: BON domain-containing protein [Acidobacteriaceae bacterium]|jgi:osmotically-inducible protein OsmY|nr:BON domain-containing protein [Acidobacteriaceae bacterium]
MGIRISRFTEAGLTLAMAALLFPSASPAQRGATDAQIQADAQRQLSNKRFSGIHVDVQNGVVTLTGQVDRYSDKEDAEKKIKQMHEAASLRDDVQVAVQGNVSDADLYQKLAKKLAYDREGYGTLPFNSLTLQVHDGVATVGGVVVLPADKDSALSLVKNTPGIRDVVDHIQVAPVSPMDNRIRRAEERAIYGFSQLNRYALNPAKPIRIIVINGHVTLTGVVDSKSDRDVAGVRANGVPGVFSVTNDLQVAGQNQR